ncbi:MAG: hypothetical protein ABH824_01695 [Nanoarchaeota archaeon]|nr:hypothetical protein [Nanoarchaeota archaeon]MBU1632785.1 hypothetical protein [Nanoarchaeota archaeon]MBU1876710.1 hypothetical protein [Nanoarchaeota archaeon]
MDNLKSEDETDNTDEQMLDQGGIESSEEGFMKGYSDEEEVEECSECGSAIEEDKKVVREIDGERYSFCSKTCADDFEESVG